MEGGGGSQPWIRPPFPPPVVRSSNHAISTYVCYFCGHIFRQSQDYERHLVHEHQTTHICYQLWCEEMGRKKMKTDENDKESSSFNTNNQSIRSCNQSTPIYNQPDKRKSSQDSLSTVPPKRSIADTSSTVPPKRSIVDTSSTVPPKRSIADTSSTVPPKRSIVDTSSTVPSKRSVSRIDPISTVSTKINPLAGGASSTVPPKKITPVVSTVTTAINPLVAGTSSTVPHQKQAASVNRPSIVSTSNASSCSTPLNLPRVLSITPTHKEYCPICFIPLSGTDGVVHCIRKHKAEIESIEEVISMNGEEIGSQGFEFESRCNRCDTSLRDLTQSFDHIVTSHNGQVETDDKECTDIRYDIKLKFERGDIVGEMTADIPMIVKIIERSPNQ